MGFAPRRRRHEGENTLAGLWVNAEASMIDHSSVLHGRASKSVEEEKTCGGY